MIWLHKVEQFFRPDRMANGEWVWLTSFYMEGAAQEWYYCLEQNHGAPTWPNFADKVQQAFGPSARSNPHGVLMWPTCNGTVEEYKAQFWTLPEQNQIDLFTAGLRNPLDRRPASAPSLPQRCHGPCAVFRALLGAGRQQGHDTMGLARSFELRLELDANEDTTPNHAPCPHQPVDSSVATARDFCAPHAATSLQARALDNNGSNQGPFSPEPPFEAADVADGPTSGGWPLFQLP